MKRPLLASILLVLFCAATASAAGVNLGWDDCGGGPATLDRVFACDTDAGADLLVGSFVAPAGVLAMNGNEIVIDIASPSIVSVPPWWQFQSGSAGTGCRSGAIQASFDFTAGPSTCADFWAGRAVGGYVYQLTSGLGMGRSRLLLVCAVTPADAGPLTPGVEYYSFKVAFRHIKTTGTTACAGCTAPVCLVLNQIRITQDLARGLPNIALLGPANRQFVTWQGGAVPGGCPAATPAKNASWGAVKALYR